MSSFVPFNVVSPLEIMGFGQETGETFKKPWERVLELHRRTQPKMELSILIKHFYFGLLPSFQNALDIMVVEPFFTFGVEQAYNILNGLAYFSLVDEAGVLTRLEKIERSLNNLDLGNQAKEQPLVELKNYWEPCIEIIIGSEKFHA